MMPLAIGPAPLLAAGLDWLEALLPVLFILFWILSQVVAVVKKVAGTGEQAKPASPPVRPPRPVAVDRPVQGDLQDEIREFLRREPRPASKATERPQPTPTPQPTPQPTLPRMSGESITEKVKKDFVRELEHLSTPLTADRVLVSPQQAGVAAAASPATEIVRSLRSPATLRQLVVVREILDRPIDRW